jgi:hypothetical protein
MSNFNPDDYTPHEWYHLSNGRMIDKDGEALKQIHFDFNGGGVIDDGYVKGFIYSDGKFFGWLHYLATANMPSEQLQGTYNFINNGIELKGICFAGNDKYGFFIRLSETTQMMQENVALPVNSQKVKKKAKKKVHPLETHKYLLTKDLIETLINKAEPIKSKSRATKFDHYKYVIDLKPQPKDFDSVVMAMSIAYSWMPTMLDIYINDVKDKKRIVKAVQNLGSIKSLSDFDTQKKNTAKWLTELVTIVNHSIVGVSKTLHIFFPKNIPIIDSRVLKTWNDLHKSKFNRDKTLKLPLNIPLTTLSMVNTYLLYWRYLLCWGHNSRVSDLRKIEETLYWLGAKQKK